MILLISTADKTCHFALADDQTYKITKRHSWLAERRLAQELLSQLESFLSVDNQTLTSLTGIVVFRGPGSYTGLRIGITVCNALADSLNIPICGETGEQWEGAGLNRLSAEVSDRIVLPEYGADPHITTARK